MHSTVVDFVSGNLAGWSFITMGMPLDLIKTQLQLRQHVSLQGLKSQVKKENGFFKTFYKGASSLYLFSGVATAAEFTTFEAVI